MRSHGLFAVLAILAATSPVLGQEQAPPPGSAITAAPQDDLAGWYDVTLKIPPAQCRLKQDSGGEWKATVEATRGRRGLVLHLEQLRSWFTSPVLISVQPDGAFGFSGPTMVNLGAFNARANFTLNGSLQADRQAFDGTFAVRHSLCSFEGSLSGKRTAAPLPPAEQPPIGASVFTDSAIPYSPPAPEPSASGPSPLINGRYLTRLSVTESRCIGGDRRGSWNGTLDLKPQAGILIPLQDYGPIFAAPIILQVQGLVLKQSTQIPLNIGPLRSPVPATFDGNFLADGSRFQVRFEAGTGLCRIGGTIVGTRT